MVLLVLAIAAHATWSGDCRFGRAVVCLPVLGPALADLEVADELLVLTGVLERVAALAELFGRRLYALLGVRHRARVVARGLAGGAPFGLALLRPRTFPGNGALQGLPVRRVAT